MNKLCKQIQNMIETNADDRMAIKDKLMIDEHLSTCNDCLEFAKAVEKSVAILRKINSYQPVIDNEEFMVNSIMRRIGDASIETKIDYEISLLDRIVYIVSKRSVRFALAAILIFVFSIYFTEEFSSVKKISLLETQLNETGQLNFRKAEMIPLENGFTKLIFNIYNFTRGNSSYLKLSQDLMLVRKEDLKKLLTNFDKLDEATKERIKTLQKELLNDKEVNFVTMKEEKVKELQNEIEKLNKELQKIKMRGGK